MSIHPSSLFNNRGSPYFIPFCFILSYSLSCFWRRLPSDVIYGSDTFQPSSDSQGSPQSTSGSTTAPNTSEYEFSWRVHIMGDRVIASQCLASSSGRSLVTFLSVLFRNIIRPFIIIIIIIFPCVCNHCSLSCVFLCCLLSLTCASSST